MPTSSVRLKAMPCQRCGVELEDAARMVLGSWLRLRRLCPECVAVRQALREEQERELAEERRGVLERELEARAGRIAAELDTGLGVPAKYWGVRLSNCDEDDANTGALAIGREWLRMPAETLTLWGNAGTGKTHIAVALLHELYCQGRASGLVFYTTAQLITALREAMDTFKADALRDELARRSCLVLDDLGAEYGTGWTGGQIIALIAARESNNRPTIITTNLSPTEIAKTFDDRLASRLCGGWMVKMGGEDRRVLTARGRKLVNARGAQKGGGG